MNGFHGPEANEQRESPLSAPNISDMTRYDVQRAVARSYRLRAERLRRWGRDLVQLWGSVFRRPGHLLPAGMRSRHRVADREHALAAPSSRGA